ncbi:hypothetical protein [Desulfobacula sp.]
MPKAFPNRKNDGNGLECKDFPVEFILETVLALNMNKAKVIYNEYVLFGGK